MSGYETDLWLDLVSGGVAAALLVSTRIRALARFEAYAYAAVGLLGLVAFFNYGDLRHYDDEGFVNRWELVHYHLGARYTPELGYDGLYAASLVAQRESHPDLPTGPMVRDLRTNGLVPLRAHDDFAAGVKGRFSEARWEAFKADQALYIENTEPDFWLTVRVDHGLNPTPFWLFLARLFAVPVPTAYGSLVFLALLDAIGIGVALGFVVWAFGWRVACLCAGVLGLGYGWHYNFIGAFLRLDWWVASVIGLCCLRRQKFLGAGASFGWAALSRLFPLALLIGPMLLAARSIRAGQRPDWAVRLVGGFVLMVCLGLALGSLTGRGAGVWGEFSSRIGVHLGTPTSNAVGVRTVAAYLPEDVVALFQSNRAPETAMQRADARPILRLGLSLALAVSALLAMWRCGEDRVTAAILGSVVVFALTTPSSYYWVLVAWLPLAASGVSLTISVLGVAAALHGIEALAPGFGFVRLHYAAMSWALFGLFFGWVLARLALPARPGPSTA